MTAKPFKTLFMAHAPDADKDKHRASIDTGSYQLDVVIVRSQAEALEVSRRSFLEKGIEYLKPAITFTETSLCGSCP